MDDGAKLRWTAAEARTALAGAQTTTLASMIPRGGGVLVVAPHPDDESLGCGGLIAHACDAGHEVLIACLTDGAASHLNSARWPPARLAALRRNELDEASALLSNGRAKVRRFDAPDGRLETCEAESEAWLAKLIAEHALASVFAPWIADPHTDHKAAWRIAAKAVARSAAALFAYPVWGLTLADDEDAGPAGECLKLDISFVLARKRGALKAHRSQTSALINDDPDGFRLRPEDLDRHLGAYESFIRFGHK